MYNYYYIKTDCFSSNWNTSDIQEFLYSFNIFEDNSDGIFFNQNPFISISLMKIRDVDSWSCLDFDKDNTNYLSIITSELSDNDTFIQSLLEKLELFLGFRLCLDD